MADRPGHLRRLLSATGLYAAAAAAQRGIGFLLIPIYTRLIAPDEYGALEMVNAFSSVVFAVLLLGMASAVNKCFHRDCESEADRAGVLPTALAIAVPALTLGVVVLWVGAGVVSQRLLGSTQAIDLVRLVLTTGWVSSVVALFLATLRAEERPGAFGVLSLVQFTSGLILNVFFVVHQGMGVRGVLWGNLLSNLFALGVALATMRRGGIRVQRRLIGPMLRFGIPLLPALLAAWVMDLSDRYVLGAYHGLGEVAVYGVGYKVGQMMEFAVVWPFQLAWPAFSFAISREPGHRDTYARTLTYFVTVATFVTIMLGVASRAVLPVMLGEAYHGAYVVVPLVALAYALNGVQYTLSPGVHLAGRTPTLAGLAVLAGVVNLAANFLLIPTWGMIGAAWSTAVAFGVLAVGTGYVAQRFYPVPLEYGRLAKVIMAGVATYVLVGGIPTSGGPVAVLVTTVGAASVAFALLIVVLGVVNGEERAALLGWLRRDALASS